MMKFREKKSLQLANWVKGNLLKNSRQTILSIVLVCLISITLQKLLYWLFLDSVWSGNALACRQASGACLSFIREKFVFILFGLYPREILWRPITAMVLFIALIIYSKNFERWNRKLLYAWMINIVLCLWLMYGASSDKWGGLPLTLMLASVGIFFSYPLGILLALARRSRMPLIRIFAISYIELIRGVPLISVLFMASILFPLFLPEGVIIPKLLRAQVAIIFFASAYMAEVVRGGLAAIDRGQYEAAQSMGLNYFQSMRYIILPQALKHVIAPTVNTAIGMFKDTSLVAIIALFDLSLTTKTALKDPDWLGFSVEAYLFASLIYFIFCFSMGRYSLSLEKKLSEKTA
jgi:general L-amino acid transport system permease protein